MGSNANPAKYEFNGYQLTSRELSQIKGCTPDGMRNLIKRYGAYGAMKVELRRERMKHYHYNGETYELKELADKLGVLYSTLSCWIARYGYDDAIRFAVMTPDERKELTRQRLRERASQAREADRYKSPIPPKDPLYEAKQRLFSWKKEGVPEEQIMMRLKMMREAAL